MSNMYVVVDGSRKSYVALTTETDVGFVLDWMKQTVAMPEPLESTQASEVCARISEREARCWMNKSNLLWAQRGTSDHPTQLAVDHAVRGDHTTSGYVVRLTSNKKVRCWVCSRISSLETVHKKDLVEVFSWPGGVLKIRGGVQWLD